MATPNELLYIKQVCPKINGPVLEIGALLTAGYRELFAPQGFEFITTDLEDSTPPGRIDVICDLTTPENPLPKNYFDLVLCCSVMEHVPNPWIMAEKISEVVRPGGKLYISVPWVWKYHGYPKDYYRFTYSAIQYLYPAFEWDHFAWSSKTEGDILFQDMNNITDRSFAHIEFGADGIETKKYLKYLNSNMLGTKKHA
jgi:SAM-dependent methyltransferase